MALMSGHKEGREPSYGIPRLASLLNPSPIKKNNAHDHTVANIISIAVLGDWT